MRYKAMAVKLRQATGTADPTPTERLLDEPRCEVVARLLEDFRRTFSSLEEEVGRLVDPGAVLAEEAHDKRLREALVVESKGNGSGGGAVIQGKRQMARGGRRAGSD